MTQVHIFGLNHFYQWVKAGCWSAVGKADEQQQKAGFRLTLEEMIRANGVELIAEEAHPNLQCLGRVLAEERGINYCDITMPVVVREMCGITCAYDRQRATRAAAYRVFEQYMFEQTKVRGAKVTLVLCGRRHFRALERLFKDAGDDAKVYDINDYEWHRGRPKESVEGIVGYDREED